MHKQHLCPSIPAILGAFYSSSLNCASLEHHGMLQQLMLRFHLYGLHKFPYGNHSLRNVISSILSRVLRRGHDLEMDI